MSQNQISPRKLPIQARARATWEAIVEAAAQLLSTSGLAGFNTNAVAMRAGVSVGTLYQYFPNKDALMAALIAREQAARADALGRIVASVEEEALEKGVTILIDASVAGEQERPQLSRILDQEEARLPVSGLLRSSHAALDAHIAGFLQPHFPMVPEFKRQEMGRTMRVIARALIDDAINLDPPDTQRARIESRTAILGYLDKHRSQP